ncbi:hypothetical protein J3A64_004475 [Pseudarthrobacter sp. PvP004]|nr:hypothetical protein [Pseudarthrobacter sp. PvP004]
MFAADAGVGVWMAAMTIDTVVVRRLVLLAPWCFRPVS